MKKTFISLALFFFMSCFQVMAQDSQTSAPADFNSRLQLAFRTAMAGHADQAKPIFEELLKANPKEWIIYYTYANAMKASGEFETATKIYERALTQAEAMGGKTRAEEIQDLIKRVGQSKRFYKDMQGAPPWEEAKVFGSGQFVIKTNIPEQYYPSINKEISQIYQKETALLAQIFGASDQVPSYMKIYIFGRWQEYLAFVENQLPADYDPDQKLLAHVFDGQLDGLEVAQNMAFFLLHERYLKEPSRWLQTGLVRYFPLKVQKENSKSVILGALEYSNWLYNQGQWEGINDFFSAWGNLEKQGLPAKEQWKVREKFDLMAWSLIQFFLDGGDSFYNTFFKEYLKYEQKNGFQSREEVRSYFDEHLSKEKQNELSDKWIKYVLSLTFEKI